MRDFEGVKPDPGVWTPLLESYRLTALPDDTVLSGTLRSDLDAASPAVTDALERWHLPAYLHHDGGRTQVVLVYPTREARARRPWVHLALFAATLLTTLGAGALMTGRDPFGTRILEVGRVVLPYPSGLDWSTLMLGAPFAFPFLGVLLAHEMGHYFAARVHRVRATLPYFVPFPPYFSIIGTLGAFIRLKSPSVRRSVLFDIGAAGPLASFLLSVPLLAIGLALSHVVPGRATGWAPFVVRFAGEPVWLGNGLMTHALATLFAPGPVGEAPIVLHPLALVGWLGLFVTALNLLPLGQLDGGHILYSLSPMRHVPAARLFMLALLPLGLVWWGWWAWVIVIAVLHRGRVRHPPVIQEEPPVGPVRSVVGGLIIVIFLLSFVPLPVRL